MACIGIIAYILANVVHEGLGHGGACLITGGRPLLITTVNMTCSADNRLVIAGGSLMNAAAAGLFFLIGRKARRISPHLRSAGHPPTSKMSKVLLLPTMKPFRVLLLAGAFGAAGGSIGDYLAAQ